METALNFPRNRKKMRAIGIIPLIDIAMFLLIFFIVAGTLEKFEIIPITPPVAESGRLMDEGHIMILLGSREEIVINDELSDLKAMEADVKKQLAANPNKIITVKADAGIPAVRMIQVMDRIKNAGGKNLSIVTQSGGVKRADSR